MLWFSAIWRKSPRKTTLSPVWTKGACSAGGENSLSREQNQRAEQSRNSLETPTSHTEPRDNTNTPKPTAPTLHSQLKQEAMLEPLTQQEQPAPGTQGTAGAKLTCKAHTGRCVCMGHPGTGSHTELPCGSASPCSHSLQQAEPRVLQ